MRKLFIWALAVISFVDIALLIFVQVKWIRDAFDVQKQQFDLMVNKSMVQVVSRLENQETVETFSQIRDELTKSGDTTLIKELMLPDHMAVDNYVPTPPSWDETPTSYTYNEQGYLNPDSKVDLISGDSLLFLREQTLYLSENANTRENLIITQPDFEENYRRLLANKKIYVEKVFNQIVRNEGRIEDRLSFQELDSAIRIEFADKGILLPYEFAVRTGNTRYTLNTKEFSPNTDFQRYSTLLFPHDIRTIPNFIVVYFPGRKDYLAQSVGLMAGTSLGLAMIILIISFITIYVIFKQKKLSEIKNDFINNMTHELKTPISTISLASQMLADKNLGPDRKNLDYISTLIQDESKRLGTQVERVLQMSILERGTMNLKIKPINLNELVEQAVEKTRIQVEQKQGRIDLQLEETIPVIYGDEVHLTNVVFNLMDNAIKYCHIEPIIQLSTKANNQWVNLRVQDNGIGIPKEHQKRIFDKFYRVPTGNIHDVKGFGIGLSYVKKVVEHHRGQIEIHSESGKGTIFDIHLPVNRKNTQ
ncbi:MAG: HAMP domain-containing histidine kinase [Bacteroidales bacterium]|nr:HAMP domain-containing histidine kinase [Bacteroidales bacterium]